MASPAPGGKQSRIGSWVVPPAFEGDLDAELYLWVTAVAAAISLLLVIPANALAGITPWVNVGVAAFGTTMVGAFALARRGRRYPRALCVLFIALLDGLWFADDGADGTIVLWLPLAALVVALMFREKARWYALVLLALDGLALLWLDYRHPEWSLPLASRADRFTDFATGLPIVTTACAALFAIVLRAYREQHARLLSSNAELERSLAELRTLRGLLRICGWCKQIRDGDGQWVPMEAYLSARADVEFTHGICPKCADREFPELK